MKEKGGGGGGVLVVRSLYTYLIIYVFPLEMVKKYKMRSKTSKNIEDPCDPSFIENVAEKVVKGEYS